MKDNFSAQAATYAQYRPQYPHQLFEFIMTFVKNKTTAWDCGTGNGQSAKVLSKYFDTVIATDISQNQIDTAYKASNIFYSIAPAEQTDIADNSIDLVTIAQAIHWFNFDKFYAEVQRVSKPGAIIAVWMYSLLQITKEIDEIISNYHFVTLEKYWDEERKYIDDNYSSIPFPFTEIHTPAFQIEVYWSLEDLKGYLNTWSALQKFISVNSFNPVNELINKVQMYWGKKEKRKIIFPVSFQLGIIK
jgi:ubiquinone/menaquinone biosynthesis C-methylase UbiE